MTLHLPQGAGPLGRPSFDRRRFLGLAGLGITAAALSACGGGPSTSGGGNTAGKVTQVDFDGVKPAKEITFWTTNPGESGPVTHQIIKAFQQENPDITVKLVTAGADYEELAHKLATVSRGGKLPDIVNLSDVWWFQYMMNDQIIPLDSAFDAVGFETDQYVDSLLGDYVYNKASWAVPWARSTPVFYWNKDHFDKAGLDPEKAPATWDEFAEWAPKLKEATGKNAFQLPALAGYAGWSFQNNLWGWGGGWSKKDSFEITCDADESVAAIQFLADMRYKHKWAAVAGTDSIQDLAAGVASATVGSTGSLATALSLAKGFEIGVGFLPGGPQAKGGADQPVCPTGGSGVAIMKDIPVENQLAAATFIKFLTTPENTLKFAQATGYMPVRKDADPSQIIKKTPQAKTSIDQLAATRSQDYARVFLPGADEQMAATCDRILNQHKDVAAELGKLKTTLEGIYNDKVKPNI
ncbi:ABC transporter substrate-binding protein [Nocardioides sp. DS6]|uniref:ABC transporter substrate-binding protein n=1 Tax=Nocardioides eburneus TaxID=3231482 RepID=A0ABV3SWS2_9ACTN